MNLELYVTYLKYLCVTLSALNRKKVLTAATEQNTLKYNHLRTELYLITIHAGKSISRENPIDGAIQGYSFIIKLNL
jgi:hypothetical protein